MCLWLPGKNVTIGSKPINFAWNGHGPGIMPEKMKQAVLNDDWGNVALTSAQVAQKLSKVTVPPGHRLGRPWVGAWEELQRK